MKVLHCTEQLKCDESCSFTGITGPLSGATAFAPKPYLISPASSVDKHMLRRTWILYRAERNCGLNHGWNYRSVVT